MELIKDYDCTIHYHQGKANVLADSLSRKSSASLACLTVGRGPLLSKLSKMNVGHIVHETCSLLVQLNVKPTLVDKIKESQFTDPQLVKISEEVKNGDHVDFHIGEDVIIHFGNRLCVPSNEGLKRGILAEAHETTYTVHPSNTKMYKDLKEIYWWCNMKRDVAKFVA